MKKTIGIIIIFILIFFIFFKEESNQDVITISGSTSVDSYMSNVVIPSYEYENPDIKIEYQSLGSTAGFENANSGITEFGALSRDLQEEEKATGINEMIIAYEGIAIITHPSNPVTDLTQEEISGIYTGEITNWSEVGGKDLEIQVVTREAGSGTRDAFEELLDIEGQIVQNATVADGNGNVASTVKSNESAIGYVTFETFYINSSELNAVSVDGYLPTTENVQNGDYDLYRSFLIVWHDDNISQEGEDFIIWLEDNRQNLALEAGLIPVSDYE